MRPYLSIFGLLLPSYGVLCASGVVCALVVSLLRARRFHLRMDASLVLFTGALTCGIIGALVTYALVTFGVSGLVHMAVHGTLREEFHFGFVFYGGFAAGLLGAHGLAKGFRLSLAEYSRAFIPALPLAHALGRVGCFLAGCCYGKIAGTLAGVCYPPESGLGLEPRIPVQLMEAVYLLALFLILVRYANRNQRGALSLYILLYAPARFLLEFLRGDAIRGILWGLSTSQWISLFLFVGVLLIRGRKK